MTTIQNLIHQAKQNNSSIREENLLSAYCLAEQAHNGQERKSGEAYIVHPLTVASYIARYLADEEILIAALLHDVIEDSSYTLSSIHENFGENIAKLVGLLSKKDFWRTSFCKMKSNLDEMETGCYPQVFLIKIADRLHNTRTLHYLPEDKQRRKIIETHEMLVPFFEKVLNDNKLGTIAMPCERLLGELKQELKNYDYLLSPSEISRQFDGLSEISIIKYVGIDGIKKAYEEVLTEAINTGEKILAYENTQDTNIVGQEFFESYIQKRIENRIEALVICPDTLEDREYQKLHEGAFTKVRLIPNLKITANTNIVGNMVMTFTISPPEGVLLMYRANAETQKSIFYNQWNTNRISPTK